MPGKNLKGARGLGVLKRHMPRHRRVDPENRHETGLKLLVSLESPKSCPSKKRKSKVHHETGFKLLVPPKGHPSNAKKTYIYICIYICIYIHINTYRNMNVGGRRLSPSTSMAQADPGRSPASHSSEAGMAGFVPRGPQPRGVPDASSVPRAPFGSGGAGFWDLPPGIPPLGTL